MWVLGSEVQDEGTGIVPNYAGVVPLLPSINVSALIKPHHKTTAMNYYDIGLRILKIWILV